MALTASSARHSTPAGQRLHGPDVVRGVALVGVVVMNYHGYLLIHGGGSIGDSWLHRVFDPFDGPLSTRFAATFVLVAGVGVSLLTRRSRETGEGVVTDRWRLARRGVLLYVIGLLVDVIWPGTILPYYGAMFVLAAAMFTWRIRWLVVAGAAAAIAGAGLRSWRLDRELDGHSTEWLQAPGNNSIRRYLFDVAINGTHPLLPWLAFLCAGMVLGRVLTTPWWRRTTLICGAVLAVGAGVVSAVVPGSVPPDQLDVATSLDPYDRSLMYTASALGTALVAYALIDWVAGAAPRATEPLRLAGQMTLTLYLLHVLVFNLLVDVLGWIEPAGLDVALAFAIAFWVAAIAAAGPWQRQFGRGPVELVYRGFGG